MTVVEARMESPAATRSWLSRIRGRFGVHTVLIILMVIWLVPTVGLAINSFRPGDVRSEPTEHRYELSQ